MSQEFKDFIRDWQIDHRITSPTNAQSNGQVERFVQIVKNSLTKAMEGGEDLHLAILSYITMPLNHSLPSPAELLNSRKFRCLLPLQSQQPKHIQRHRRVMQEMKHQQARHYNKSLRDLPKLKTGDAVYVQLVPKARNWVIIINVISKRTYKVQTKAGGIYWRNRKFVELRCRDLRQSLKTVPGPVKDIQHSGPSLRLRISIRKPKRLIESMNQIQTQYRDYNHSPGHFQNFDRFQYRDSHNTRIHRPFNYSQVHFQNFDRFQYEDSYNTRV